MANITINTSKEDQEKLLEVLRKLDGETTPVSKLAELTGLKASTVRYAILDLVEAGKIQRVPTKAFNKHYVRYGYKVL